MPAFSQCNCEFVDCLLQQIVSVEAQLCPVGLVQEVKGVAVDVPVKAVFVAVGDDQSVEGVDVGGVEVLAFLDNRHR